ncbi:MAG: DUF1284 domain-containing protein [Nitrospirae bacterium]|nr:DUF1284 domain-containing protein [Nitrospirota bacterium]
MRRKDVVVGTVPTQKKRQDAVRLRGHVLLCLQGFRGKGYSQDFVDNLAGIHRDLAEYPDRRVEVVERPDDVCGACPNLALSGCTLNGKGSEASIQAQDRQVLDLLRLRAGESVQWGEVLDRIGTSLTGDSLADICGPCRWLPLGYCQEGIERLRKEKALSEQAEGYSE